MDDDVINHWKGIIRGPHETEYEGGRFIIDIVIPSDYPFSPPKMRFVTKVWHPNISSQTCTIGLDILNDEWSPAITMRVALISLQALLSSPNPDYYINAEAAIQYKLNRPEFERKARQWVLQYAGDPKEFQQEKIVRFTEMGFEESVARQALERAGWDQDNALSNLLCPTIIP